MCLSIGSKVDDLRLPFALIGEGGGGSIMPNARSCGAILRDKDRNAIVGLPAKVELEMYGGSELRLDDRLVILGGCQTTCFLLRISMFS